MTDLLSEPRERLLDFNMTLIRYLMAQFEIQTRLVCLTDLHIEAREPRLSVEISEAAVSLTKQAQAGAARHLDQGLFAEAGIPLRFFTVSPPVYPQLWGPFVPNLSALDLLFNCGPKSHGLLIRGMGGLH